MSALNAEKLFKQNFRPAVINFSCKFTKKYILNMFTTRPKTVYI